LRFSGGHFTECLPFLILVGLWSCSPDQDTDPANIASALEMPTIELAVSHPNPDGPGSTLTQIVVGDSGQVIFRPPVGSGHAVGLLKVDGSLEYIGGEGEGPGEARLPLMVDLTGDVVTVFDLANHRVLEWFTNGRLKGSWRTPSTVVPVARIPGRGMVSIRSRQEGLYPVLLTNETSQPLDLVTPQDSLMQEMFPASQGPVERLLNIPIIGHWSGGSLIADGFAYKIALYDWDGKLVRVIQRDLPPNLRTPAQVEAEIAALRRSGRRDEVWLARESRRLAATPITWFTHLGPPRPDYKGRLWVVGQHGEQTFADIFADGEFLGRIDISCPDFASRWSLKGEWLALMCEPDDPEAVFNAVVKLYRIT
jgi:hypothetical protein